MISVWGGAGSYGLRRLVVSLRADISSNGSKDINVSHKEERDLPAPLFRLCTMYAGRLSSQH